MNAMNRKATVTAVELETHKEFSIRRIARMPDKLQTRAMEVDPVFSKDYGDRYLAGSPFPHLHVFRDPDIDPDLHMLADGYTRLDAAERLGLRAVPVVVHRGTLQDAMLFGIQANMGVLTRTVGESDRTRATQMMIRLGAGEPGAGTWDWSDTEIARMSGIAPITVRNLRITLQSSEGIPIPVRVQVFADGNPTGKTRPYRQMANGIAATSVDSRGRIRAYVDGTKLDLGEDPVAAEAALRRIQEDKEAAKGHFQSHAMFRQWLTTRLISHRALQLGETQLGGTIVGDAVVCPVPETDTESVLSAAMRATVHQARIPGIRRRIIVGLRPGNPRASVAVREVSEAGVIFMESAQFLVEFSPSERADLGASEVA